MNLQVNPLSPLSTGSPSTQNLTTTLYEQMKSKAHPFLYKGLGFRVGV